MEARLAGPLLLLALGAVLLALLPSTAAAQQPKTFSLGFLDSRFSSTSGGAWLDRAVGAQSDLIRVGFGWDSIALRPPANPTDPADPAYRWVGLDSMVRSVTERGLAPIVNPSGAPRWAEGPNRPRQGIASGSWRPNADAFGAFAQALATRYSGTYPDPLRPGQPLPRVSNFQAWNEPNLPRYLAPQWENETTPVAPTIYRALLNSFYAGVKNAQPDALVIGANTAPFGDPPGLGQRRMQPLTFVTELLKETTYLDVLAHHPYAIRGPSVPARNIGDVSIGNMSDLRSALADARKRGNLPGAPKRLWITEFSWDGAPDPEGVEENLRARWVAEAFYVAWKQGVDTLIWWLAGDQLPQPSYAATYQSGMYFADGRPKTSLRAFQFPLIADRLAGNKADVWTRAPYAGTMVIQTRRKNGRWRSAATLRVERHQVVVKRISAKLGTQVRARMGTTKSLPSRVRTVW